MLAPSRTRLAILAGLILATAASAAASVTAAHAQYTVDIGTLECTSPGGVGLILGSKTNYTCKFVAVDGKAEPYAASVTRIGLDIGITGKTVMVWSVLSTGKTMRPGMLAGSYVGAAADASVGIGAGAKLLVGGSKRSITLQPLSVQGQSGVNLAVGVAELTIR